MQFGMSSEIPIEIWFNVYLVILTVNFISFFLWLQLHDQIKQCCTIARFLPIYLKGEVKGYVDFQKLFNIKNSVMTIALKILHHRGHLKRNSVA